ncbi:MAG: hypothetical protein B7Y25_06620 [Alphaproteobacteria bacterium 16-39-46]|nr:MAG: hypothetical protein B7Y25_06620 [Alphaproteobacteria bacterium 16-39-46]OZA42258.1 MAG: hypothetical protein B7X84_06695 [Alphaproteobacteria bacterium 17-39-52]
MIKNFSLSPDLLYTLPGIEQIDDAFLIFLEEESSLLHDLYLKARECPPKDESAFLLELAPILESFMAQFFEIEKEVFLLQKSISELAPLYLCRRLFVQRIALKEFSFEEAITFDGKKLEQEIVTFMGNKAFDPLAFAHEILLWLKRPEDNEYFLKISKQYAAWRVLTPDGKSLSSGRALFSIPHKLDFQNLFETITGEWGEKRVSPHHIKRRDGFNLTDPGHPLDVVLKETHYCILCGPQGKDSCSKGLCTKTGEGFVKNALGVELKGCPLKQKISEMNTLVNQGHMLGALAIICIDNPMTAATGWRICNDCKQSCIYQKQDPVDVPSIETQILKSVLELPFGFEIYSLLTRWNPLNIRYPLPSPQTGYKILVVGMGPAGFTLAHYLLNAGHAVVACDGLKIEPLPTSLVGEPEKLDFKLIKNTDVIFQDLSDRVIGGFGGVMEYGITSRWNKNFLTIIRLLLERRRPNFTLLGNTRFGGVFNESFAKTMGFDHIALCVGAGPPHLLSVNHGLAKGVRYASDFLMNLQLGGAFGEKSLANLVIRLPIIVLGGGLTAVDTATEAQAYYCSQALKFLERYEALVVHKGQEAVQSIWSQEDKEIGQEFLYHGRCLREERNLAFKEKRAPHFTELIQKWGGVLIAYRKSFQESPAYRLNPEELKSALEEGIGFLENVSLVSMEKDENGWISGIKLQRDNQETIEIAAKSIVIAYGTGPNSPENVLKDAPNVSFFGEVNPLFSGSVVKAMASAKEGWPVLSKTIKKSLPLCPLSYEMFSKKMMDFFEARVIKLSEIAPKILEITVKSVHAARAFRPGQFFRFQQFESNVPQTARTRFGMEGIALTGAEVDPESGLLSLIVLQMGASTDLCSSLKVGEHVALMGPTGMPTEIPTSQTVLLIGGGLGNAVLFSVGKAMRENGSRVLYVAGYKKLQDRFKVDKIEGAADCILWCMEENLTDKNFLKRPQDFIYQGSVTEGLLAYAQGKLGSTPISLEDVQHVLAIGSQGMMEAVEIARQQSLKPYLSSSHKAYASINAPMQCMMKEICAQCLVSHKDPETGLETIVFSCSAQDQNLNTVDFSCLKDRLNQNHLAENLTRQWIEYEKGRL